jgi:hypothetical protein
VRLLRENANNDPQGMSSLFGSLDWGQQQGAGIGNLVSGLLGGGGGADSNQQDPKQQQQQKKEERIRRYVGLVAIANQPSTIFLLFLYFARS